MIDLDTEYNEPRTREHYSIKAFIEKLETLPVLWDSSHEDYYNKSERDKASNNLLSMYQKIKPSATTDDVIKEIYSLRSKYRKMLIKMKSMSSINNLSEQCCIPRSWIFYILYFLKEDIETEPVDSEYNNNAMVEVKQLKDDTDTSCVQNEIVRSRNSSSCSTQLAENPPPAKIPKQKDKAQQTELPQKTCSCSPQSVVPQSSLHPNIIPISVYWSDKLQKIDQNQRMFAEKIVNDVLFEAELGNLHSNCVYFKRNHSPRKNRKHK